ncbi:MAG: hypothetical protein FJ135_01885 [Deltaproteobacteria bacterium]|nr:hypothetical protein [Deltaproteobacteria bacterium]
MATDLGELLVKLQADVENLKQGLASGKAELQNFKTMAEGFGAQVKKALTITAGALGIAALISEFKSLWQGVTEVGAKLETARLAAYAVGENFGYTAGTIDLLVNELKKLKITTTDAYQAVSQFISHGLDPRQLAPIAQAARDLAVAAGKSPQEMFKLLIDSIVTGMPRALREAKIPIREFQDSVLAEGKNLDENLKLSAQERSQVMIDLILKYAETVKGVSESTAGAHSRQLGQIKYLAGQVKEVLWDFMQPLLTAVTGEKIRVWSDLLTYLTANRGELQKWGQTIGDFIRMVWEVIAAVVSWVVANGNLVKTFIELAVVYKLAGYITAIGAAIPGVVSGLYALATGATVVKAAFGGWLGVLIQVLVALGTLGAYKIAKIAQEKPGVARSMAMGEAEWVQSDKDRAAQWEADRQAEARERARRGVYKTTEEKLKDLTPEQQRQYQELQNQIAAARATGDLDKQVQEAMAKWKELFGEKPGAGKGGGGKESTENLLAEELRYLEAKRNAEIQEYQASLERLKANNEAMKAELEKQLEEGLIDGQEYYSKLRAMEEAEFQASLTLVRKKQEAQAAARRDALRDLERQDLSPEAAEYRRKAIEEAYRKEMAALTAEEIKIIKEHEAKVTKELEQQLKLRKEIKETLATQAESAAFGPMEEREARINALLREQKKLREEVVRKGATPEELGQLDAISKAKEFAARFGDQIKNLANAMASGFSDIIDSLMQGGQNLMAAANRMFRNLLNAALKPGFEQLTQWLMNALKEMFGALGSGLAMGILGVIALVGMALTSAGGGSSFTPSGVQKGVASHEAVRGLIAGETSIPIAQIGESLQDALAPTNSILQQIEANTRNLGGGASVQVMLQGVHDAVKEAIEGYFREYLVMGAGS